MTVTVYGNNVSVKATPKTKEIIDEINKKIEKTENKKYLSVEDLLRGDDETIEIYNTFYKTHYVEN